MLFNAIGIYKGVAAVIGTRGTGMEVDQVSAQERDFVFSVLDGLL